MHTQKGEFIIVGGVAAGMKTACRIARLNPEARITVLEREQNLSYGACALPYYVEGLYDNLDEVRMTPGGAIRNEAFFHNAKGVNVLARTEATAIDREKQTVRVRCLDSREEKSLRYDKLVLATGSTPIIPPLPGTDLDGVLPLKRMEDAAQIDALAEKGQRAVIVGGGLIGLEMAEALIHRGLEVTLLEMKDQVMATALDYGMAALVHKELRQKKVNLRLSEPLEQIVGEGGQVKAVVTAAGRYDADLVLLSIGVRPNVSLAKDCGLTLGPTGAIAVDDRMCTSDPNIFAAGDCAESTDLITGRKVYVPLGSTANKHGRVVADNICGRPERFPGVLGSLIVKVFDLNIGRTGLSCGEARLAGFDPVTLLATSPDKVHIYPTAKPITIELVADRKSRRLLGAQGVGYGEVAKRIDTVVASLTLGATVDQLAQMDLAYAPPYAAAMDVIHQTANALRNKLDGLAASLPPVQVFEKMQNGEELILLDIRSEDEAKAMPMSNSRGIPLGALRTRYKELPKDKEIVPFCKIGLRGYEAQLILERAGFTHVRYMEGGLLAWPFER